MRKHRRLCKYACSLFLLVLFLYGCKTVPRESSIKPVELLNKNDSLYISVPVQKYKDMMKNIMVQSVGNLSDKDLNNILNHIEYFYAGLGSIKNPDKFEAILTGNIPLGTNFFLNKKNGWIEKKYSLNKGFCFNDKYKYYIFEQKKIQIAFLSNTILSISENSIPVLERYANINYNKKDKVDVLFTKDMEEWLSRPSEEIRFLVLRPQSFLSNLIGTKMPFALVNAKGILKNNTDPNKFSLTLYLTFEKTVVVNAAATLLRLAIGNEITLLHEKDTNELVVGNISVNEKLLSDILCLNK